jgi:probable F420-dependent oxidoreductase
MTGVVYRDVQIGVDIPQRVAGEAGSLVARYCTLAEELGFAGLWAMDDVVSATPFLDGLEVLTYAAAVTQKVTLGIAVLIVSRHNPALLAKRFATLDHLSGGRLIVGLGAGHDDDTVAGLGFASDRLAARSNEAIAVMKALWTESRASFDGAFWRFSELAMEPKPLQQPHPPIWLAARQPAALRRAAKVADGWIGAGSASTAQFAEQVPVIEQALAQEERDPGSFPIGKRVYIAVDDDSERGRERVTAFIDPIYGREGLGEQVAVYGPPSRCIEGLRQVIDAGARHLVLSPVDDHLAQLRALADLAQSIVSSRSK